MRKDSQKKQRLQKRKRNAPTRRSDGSGRYIPPKHTGEKTLSCFALFRGTSRGFGFAIPEPSDVSPAPADIFIPPSRTHGALDGDRVLVSYHTAPPPPGKTGPALEGEVLRIEQPLRRSVIGTLFFRSELRGRRILPFPFLRPDDSHLPDAIPLLDDGGASEGDKVEAALPTAREELLRARVLRNFGRAADRTANYAAILAACDVPVDFDGEAVAEAQERAALPLHEHGRTRVRESVFTIDGADAKDLDDAVSIRALPDGRFLLGVHIADVSEYVTEGSALDRTAMQRGTSLYFTDRVVPMLPEALSNGACSLHPGADKYALSAFIRIDADGEILGVSIRRTLIRSKVRGVYSEVNDLLQNRKQSPFYAKYRGVYTALSHMERLYRILYEKSRRRGALELDRGEPVILLDDSGDPAQIFCRTRGVAERMIEQFMLAANEAVARELTARGCPCIYRVHARPLPDRLSDFLLYAHNLGLSTAELQDKNLSCLAFSHLLAQAKEQGLGEAVSYTLLRTMAKAEYSDTPALHFALGIPLYCHFTSPIRRLSDLGTHRILKAVLLDGKKPGRYAAYAKKAAEAASACELRALDAERQIEALYKTIYMAHHIGETFPARISSVTPFGFFAELENTCEGLVPIGSLAGEYLYEEEGLRLRSSDTVYRIGDSVCVCVEEADISTRKVTFSVPGDRADTPAVSRLAQHGTNDGRNVLSSAARVDLSTAGAAPRRAGHNASSRAAARNAARSGGGKPRTKKTHSVGRGKKRH